VKICGSLDEL